MVSLFPLALFICFLSPVLGLIWPTWLAQWWYGGPPTVRPPTLTQGSEPDTSPLPPAEAWKTYSEEEEQLPWQRDAPSKSWRPIGAKFYPPPESYPSSRVTNLPPAKVSAHFFEVIHFTKSIQRLTTPKPNIPATDCTPTTKAEENPVGNSFKPPPKMDQFDWRPSVFNYPTSNKNTSVSSLATPPPAKVTTVSPNWSEELKETEMTPAEQTSSPDTNSTEPTVLTNTYQDLFLTVKVGDGVDEVVTSSIEVVGPDSPTNEELSFRTDSLPQLPKTEVKTNPPKPLEIQKNTDEALLTKSISIARTYPDRFEKSGIRYGFGFRFPSHLRPLGYGTTSTVPTSSEIVTGNFSERGIRYETGFRPMYFYRKPLPKSKPDNLTA